MCSWILYQLSYQGGPKRKDIPVLIVLYVRTILFLVYLVPLIKERC